LWPLLSGGGWHSSDARASRNAGASGRVNFYSFCSPVSLKLVY
jgi:hypothetical protein